VHPGAFIWVHAHSESNGQAHLTAAQEGAWVEFDGISETSAEKHLQLVKGMLDQGLSERVLISQDAGWYHVGEPKGGNYRSHTFVFANFVPMMRQAGISTEHVRTLLIDNPRKALTLQVRRFTRTSP
jgi:phosphotriesterase-related protein